MTGFSAGYHISDTEKRVNKGFSAAAVACGAVLIALIVVMVVVARINAYEDRTIPDFTAALESGNYEEALSIYRNVQDQVLADSPDANDNTHDERIKLLGQMESIVQEKVDLICDRIVTTRYVPQHSDIAFLDSMQELTASVVARRLNSLCEQFLLGKIEKPDVIFVFNQLSPISNFSAISGPMLREIDYIETATGDVRVAEKSLATGDYVENDVRVLPSIVFLALILLSPFILILCCQCFALDVVILRYLSFCEESSGADILAYAAVHALVVIDDKPVGGNGVEHAVDRA